MRDQAFCFALLLPDCSRNEHLLSAVAYRCMRGREPCFNFICEGIIAQGDGKTAIMPKFLTATGVDGAQHQHAKQLLLRFVQISPLQCVRNPRLEITRSEAPGIGVEIINSVVDGSAVTVVPYARHHGFSIRENRLQARAPFIEQSLIGDGIAIPQPLAISPVDNRLCSTRGFRALQKAADGTVTIAVHGEFQAAR